jgi:hypothetical protein
MGQTENPVGASGLHGLLKSRFFALYPTKDTKETKPPNPPNPSKKPAFQ